MFRSVPDNVILIGFSGTGKSTVATLLARALGWPWIDTDQLIVGRLGKSIADVFREDGEDAFRAAEREAVADVCSRAFQVISVGGGVPVDRRNRDVLLDRNHLVRLDARPETILNRLRSGPNAEERPMLAGADPLSRITGLLLARASAYSIVDFSVDTNDRGPEDVAQDVIAFLASRDIHPRLEVVMISEPGRRG